MADIEELKKVCEKAGVRLTHQRIEIYKEIKASRDHPSVEALYERLKPRLPTISLDTVYRTLTMFVELGLIKRVYGKEPVTRFDPDTSVHHHLICQRCGAIYDFLWPDLESVPMPKGLKGLGEVDYVQVQFIGICNKCLKKEEKKNA